MRKPRRLSPEELLPFQWQMPRSRRQQYVEPREGEGQEETKLSEREGGISTSSTSNESISEPLHWCSLFGNPNPVEIEIGMGKGLFLLTSAMARPETNFFGIEIVRKYQLFATTRFALRQLRNVKTVCADARWVLRQFVPVGSVRAVHVYFPDPWWKARHKKRRVFTSGFAAAVARTLVPGGRLLIASDVDEYFGTMTGIIKASSSFREIRSESTAGSLENAGYQTNFERKARLKGTPIWRAEFERIPVNFQPNTF